MVQGKVGKEETGVFSFTTDMPYVYPKINASDIHIQLNEIIEAEDEKNNGLFAYIKDGKIAFDTYDNLFTITPFSED